MYYFIAVVTIVLALYGTVKLISGSLTKEDGQRAAETMSPFMTGVASVAQEKLRQSLVEIPDEQLERNSELYVKKLYPLIKGTVRGLADSMEHDPNAAEMRESAYRAGKHFSENLMQPFTRGVLENSGPMVDELDKRFGEIRNFTEKNKDAIDIITGGLNFLQKALKNAPAPPPPPGFRQPSPRPDYYKPYDYQTNPDTLR